MVLLIILLFKFNYYKRNYKYNKLAFNKKIDKLNRDSIEKVLNIVIDEKEYYKLNIMILYDL